MTRATRSEWTWRGLCALLALIVPTLVGYDVYFQFRAPGTDFGFDHSGLVHEVPFESYADWTGMHPGDVIQTVDGTPFLDWLKGGWHDLAQGPYMMQVERRGRLHTIEIPAIPLVKMNARSLASATLAALTFWGIGILLLLRRFQQQEIRIVYILSQVFAVLLLFPLAHPAPYLAPEWGLILSSASLYVAAPLLLHYYLTFPVVLGTPRQRRWWLGAIYGLALISLVLWRIHSPWQRWSAACIVLQVVTAVVVLIYVYARRAPPDGRRRLRLVVLGNIAAALPGVFFYILPQMFQAEPYLPEWLLALCLVIAPSSYLYATLRHNLFGIDRFLNRAIVYALLSIGILTLYLGPFLLIYHFTPGDPLAQMMIAAGLTLLVGLAFERSRTQAQRLVDRLFYGGWYDYPGVVETISEALARSIERQQMADVLTRQVPALMQLRGAHLWIGEPNETEPGNVPQPQLRFAFNFQGQRQGLWTVGSRRDGEGFANADRRILQTLARQAEIALSNVLLVETLRQQLDEIRASRETLAQTQRQLLRSREEERARLARDLHDGPIQALVGLNLQLGLLLTPAQGSDLPHQGELQTMRGEVRELLTELRQVCAELRPPMLDTLGLGAALRALADDWSALCGVTVSLDLPPDATLRPLPGVVTVNLYRVVQEALSNVARHAAARSVTIQLAWDSPHLTLTLRDDGRGFVVPPTFHNLTAQGHFGLLGMQERVDLIGGTWMIESAPGQGTTVRVTWQRGLVAKSPTDA